MLRLLRLRRRGKYQTKAQSMGISALMIKCAGRFTRQQRATSYTYKFAHLGLSSVQQLLVYNFEKVPLKFGAVGVKVYMVKSF